MEDKISLLIQLQDCDNRVEEINKRKTEGPLKILKLSDELKAIEMKSQEEHNRLEYVQKDKRVIDQDIQDLENKIEKSDIKLSNIKSNKEYKAVLKEIEDFKKRKFQTEDKAIQIMEEIEQLEKKCLENRDNQAVLRKKFEKDKDEIEKELNSLDKELKTLKKKSVNFSQMIDQDLIRKYLFLKERKEGQAISSVIGGVCQTCHMGIPPQQFNELIKGHSLLTCPNCNRIIYWGENEHFQKALNRV